MQSLHLQLLVTSSLYTLLTLTRAEWLQRADHDNIYFFSTTQLTWTSALAYCQEVDASLVAINDADENAFLYDVTLTDTSPSNANERWIGLHCFRVLLQFFCDSDIDLAWTDPEVNTYREWGYGNLVDDVRYVYMDYDNSQWEVTTAAQQTKMFICEKMNPCLVTNWCVNGGSCSFDADALLGYQCACATGYTGNQCEVDIDECALYDPCDHGECIDAVNSYSCECVPTYQGVNCSEDVDECSDRDSCNSRGRCINSRGSFGCNCDKGYYGSECQKTVTSPLGFVEMEAGIALITLCVILALSLAVVLTTVLLKKRYCVKARRSHPYHTTEDLLRHDATKTATTKHNADAIQRFASTNTVVTSGPTGLDVEAVNVTEFDFRSQAEAANVLEVNVKESVIVDSRGLDDFKLVPRSYQATSYHA